MLTVAHDLTCKLWRIAVMATDVFLLLDNVADYKGLPLREAPHQLGIQPR
jgi:hypothetical protein